MKIPNFLITLVGSLGSTWGAYPLYKHPRRGGFFEAMALEMGGMLSTGKCWIRWVLEAEKYLSSFYFNLLSYYFLLITSDKELDSGDWLVSLWDCQGVSKGCREWDLDIWEVDCIYNEYFNLHCF